MFCFVVFCSVYVAGLLYSQLAASAIKWAIRHHAAYAVRQLVDALPYKPEGRGLDPRWGHWVTALTLPFRPSYGPQLLTERSWLN